MEPTKELLELTPIGEWCHKAADALAEADVECQHSTAQQFLAFVCHLNRIAIQASGEGTASAFCGRTGVPVDLISGAQTVN